MQHPVGLWLPHLKSAHPFMDERMRLSKGKRLPEATGPLRGHEEAT